MNSTVTQVLDHQQILDRLDRIAWQLYEEFHQQESLYLAGIAERGYILAGLLSRRLQSISPLEVTLGKLEFSKDQPIHSSFSLNPSEGQEWKGRHVIVVDDVLKSGSTLIYGVRHFLQFPLGSLKTVVLVDRNHKRFPVKADFKGLSLSTSLQEHVTVHLEGEPYSVTVS